MVSSVPAHDGDRLYKGEAEIARLLGISWSKWKATRGVLEAQGMRRRDPLLGLRYWPAVRSFFDRRNGLDKIAEGVADEQWSEDLNALKPRRARADAAAQR